MRSSNVWSRWASPTCARSSPCPHDKDDEYLTHNSQDFHAHMGYRLVGAFDRCAQKFGRWYDMCWMELVLAERTPNQPKPTWFPDLPKPTI